MVRAVPRIRSLRGKVYGEAERADLIGRFMAARDRAEAGDPSAAQDRLAVAHDYEAATPIVSLSRSPVDGEVFETSLDTFGLDGMWWAYDYDYRPYVEPITSMFAWTGSMQLDGPVDAVQVKAMVGPEVPFVLERILDHPAITAVVSSVLVGEHVGYPVVYYVDGPPPLDIERVNDWGHTTYSIVRADGSPSSGQATEYDFGKDFELGQWLDRGKLQWIAPGDIDLTLRSGRAGCPFVDLPGERRRQYIEGGERRFAEEIRLPTRR